MEGLGHGAFGRENGCIGFTHKRLKLQEDPSRDQPDSTLPERRHLDSATRAIPEREGTGALALPWWFSTLCRWPPQDG